MKKSVRYRKGRRILPLALAASLLISHVVFAANPDEAEGGNPLALAEADVVTDTDADMETLVEYAALNSEEEDLDADLNSKEELLNEDADLNSEGELLNKGADLNSEEELLNEEDDSNSEEELPDEDADLSSGNEAGEDEEQNGNDGDGVIQDASGINGGAGQEEAESGEIISDGETVNDENPDDAEEKEETTEEDGSISSSDEEVPEKLAGDTSNESDKSNESEQADETDSSEDGDSVGNEYLENDVFENNDNKNENSGTNEGDDPSGEYLNTGDSNELAEQVTDYEPVDEATPEDAGDSDDPEYSGDFENPEDYGNHDALENDDAASLEDETEQQADGDSDEDAVDGPDFEDYLDNDGDAGNEESLAEGNSDETAGSSMESESFYEEGGNSVEGEGTEEEGNSNSDGSEDPLASESEALGNPEDLEGIESEVLDNTEATEYSESEALDNPEDSETSESEESDYPDEQSADEGEFENGEEEENAVLLSEEDEKAKEAEKKAELASPSDIPVLMEDTNGIYGLELLKDAGGNDYIELKVLNEDGDELSEEAGKVSIELSGQTQEVEHFYKDGLRLAASYALAENDSEYVIFLLSEEYSGEDELEDSDIAYIDELTGSGGRVSFDVYPGKMETGDYFLYLSSDASSGIREMTKVAGFNYYGSYRTVVDVTDISLNKSSLSLSKGSTARLSASVEPADATDSELVWSSSNESVATVDQSGNVNAVARGTAEITVKNPGSGLSKKCSVTVTEPVTYVSLSMSEKTLKVNESVVLTATVSPADADNKSVSWESNNTAVATVNNGTVTAKAVGTAYITVRTEDGGKTAVCKITVTVAVESITLSQPSLSLKVGESATLTVNISPSNAVNKNVNWSSSNPAVATVSAGKVTAVAAGSTVIIATSEDGGKTAICNVTVTAADNSGSQGQGQQQDPASGNDPGTGSGSGGSGSGGTGSGSGGTDSGSGGTGSGSGGTGSGGTDSGSSGSGTGSGGTDSGSGGTGTGSGTGTDESKKAVSSLKISLKTTSYAYDGKEKKPAATVMDGSKELTVGSDYTISYQNNINIGTAKAVITGKGSYEGTAEQSFTIKAPAKGKVFTVSGIKYKVTNASKYTVSAVGGKNKNITSAAIPATVKIGGKSWKVTAIGAKAFQKYTKLTKLTVGNNVSSIGANAFNGCTKLSSVKLGSGVVTIGNSAFNGCTKLKSITLGNKVTSIGANAFKGCKVMTKAVLGTKVSKIGNGAFSGCTKLATLTIKSKVLKTIGKNAFAKNTSLKSLTLGDSVTSIGDSAFSGCSKLSKVTIGKKLATIGAGAFSGCVKLSTLTVNSTKLKTIGKNAFNGDKALKNITFKSAVIKTVGANAFKGVPSGAKVKVPSKKVKAYKTLFQKAGLSKKAKVSK